MYWYAVCLFFLIWQRCGNLFGLLKIWQGSIFKGVWKNLTIFCTFYAIISLCYRCILIWAFK